MSISEKIQDQIVKLDADDDFKKLMMQILSIADSGLYQYKNAYEKAINEYINSSEGAER